MKLHGNAGETNPHARLTNAQVRTARARYARRREHGPDFRLSVKTLAAIYGVSHTQMIRILRREQWKHVA